jgi:hypothetical protein
MRGAQFNRVRRDRSRPKAVVRDAALGDALPMRRGRIVRRYDPGRGSLGIRRRIDFYHYGRRPLEFTRTTAISIVAAFILLILCGIAAYRESAANPVTDLYHVAAGS